MPVCKYCQSRYKPARAMQPGRVCNSRDCQAQFAMDSIDQKKQKQAKQERIAAKEDRKVIKAKLESMKGIGELTKEAQREFNAFIRWRDRLAGFLCISSGRPLDWNGNKVDAGHYRSTGSAPHLRFDERNCHAQSKHDNRHLSGNAVDYRIGLIQRIGIEAVEALEADQTPRKYTKDQLREIRDSYREKANQLKKQSEEKGIV